MLLNLLSANIEFYCFFIFFLVSLNNFFIFPVVKENIKVKLALTIPTGAPIAVVKEIMDTPPLVALKTIIYVIKGSNTFT